MPFSRQARLRNLIYLPVAEALFNRRIQKSGIVGPSNLRSAGELRGESKDQRVGSDGAPMIGPSKGVSQMGKKANSMDGDLGNPIKRIADIIGFTLQVNGIFSA